MASVRLFVPCFVDELWPQAARAAVELAEAVGFSVQLVDAVCCGQALANSGADSTKVEARFASAASGADEVVVLSASCAGHLQTMSGGHARVPPVVEWCDWFVRYAPDRFPQRLERRVVLHGSCSALRSTRNVETIRDLLSRVDGLEVFDPADASECCGFGGTFSTEFPEMSVRMGRDKWNSLASAHPNGVEGVVSSDCSCLLHLRAIGKGALPCYHIAELLRSAV